MWKLKKKNMLSKLHCYYLASVASLRCTFLSFIINVTKRTTGFYHSLYHQAQIPRASGRQLRGFTGGKRFQIIRVFEITVLLMVMLSTKHLIRQQEETHT